ncbi:MAG: hypothetical protein UR23_C0046G0001, partial [Candidatus Roizmanbacteria bacterium GW2011_GWA2_32_13]
MKKISLGIIVLATFLTISVSPVIALTPLRNEIRNTIRETVEEGENEGSGTPQIRKEVRKNVRKELKEDRMGLLEKVKNFMKKNLRFEARVKGEITAINTGLNNFSMTSGDGDFQINITDKTKFLRKFGGKSALSEYSVGNEVVVFGKFTDDTKLIIDAKTVRNNSIQKRKGAFFGKVTIKNTDNFVIETIERGTQTVYFGVAKFVQRN